MYIRSSAKAIIRRGSDLLVVVMQDAQGLWYLCPGGGQEHGECLTDALVRECVEEIGCHVQVGDLAYVREYIAANHDAHDGTNGLHQVDFFFHCELSERCEPTGHQTSDPYQVGVNWMTMEELRCVRFFPQTLLDALEQDATGRVYLGDVN